MSCSWRDVLSPRSEVGYAFKPRHHISKKPMKSPVLDEFLKVWSRFIGNIFGLLSSGLPDCFQQLPLYRNMGITKAVLHEHLHGLRQTQHVFEKGIIFPLWKYEGQGNSKTNRQTWFSRVTFVPWNDLTNTSHSSSHRSCHEKDKERGRAWECERMLRSWPERQNRAKRPATKLKAKKMAMIPQIEWK